MTMSSTLGAFETKLIEDCIKPLLTPEQKLEAFMRRDLFQVYLRHLEAVVGENPEISDIPILSKKLQHVSSVFLTCCQENIGIALAMNGVPATEVESMYEVTKKVFYLAFEVFRENFEREIKAKKDYLGKLGIDPETLRSTNHGKTYS